MTSSGTPPTCVFAPFSIAPASLSALPRSRRAITTEAPDSASPQAIASPRPPLPPGTKAVLPDRSNSPASSRAKSTRGVIGGGVVHASASAVAVISGPR